MAFVFFNPERLQSVIGIEVFINPNSAVINDDIIAVGFSRGINQKSKTAQKYDNCQKNVSKNNRSQRRRDGDYAHRPKPIGASVPIFIFVCLPVERIGVFHQFNSCLPFNSTINSKKLELKQRSQGSKNFFQRQIREVDDQYENGRAYHGRTKAPGTPVF